MDEIIEKLLHVTDEKGADVTGFESGVVAQTIKMLESAEEAGVLTGGQEALVEEFIETMQKDGIEKACNYLENKGKEVDYEILKKAARSKITAMRDLLYTARESVVSEEEFISLLDMAEKALEEDNFEAINEFKVTFEKKLEEAKFKKKSDIIQRRINNNMMVISQFKEKGIDVEKLEELVAQANSEFEDQKFTKAEDHLDSAEKIIEDLQKRLEVVVELESIRATLSEVIDMKVEVGDAKDLLVQAESEMNADNFSKANELIEQVRSITSNNVQHFIQGKFPKFSLKLPEGGMEADVWNKCVIEIANIGDLIAKNVDIRFKGDVEVKGIEKIEKLNVGEKLQMEIGVKPKEAGALDMDVLLAYQRAFDDTIYQLNLAKNIIADVTGTYTIEEILLIHNSGILISQASRKYNMEIDRDIFSGMFTAVQDFIKDSFQAQAGTGLKRMDFGGNKILIEHGQNIFLTAIIAGGEPRYLPLYMVEVLKEVEDKYGEVLDGWRGDYAKIEGIEAIIEKLLMVSDEKGADVAGFESGVVASTIKIIEAAEQAGVVVGGQEAFIEEFMETMKKDGFERAWNYLENKGSLVDMEISADTAKSKISAMQNLMASAREWGMSEDEFISMLEEAEEAFDSGNFEKVDEYQDTFEKKIEEGRLKQTTDIIWRRIKNAMVVISQFKEKGIDVEKPEELLTLADSEFREKQFEEAEKDVDLAEKLAEELRKKHDIKIELETIRETLTEIKSMKVDVEEAYNLLSEAESEMNAENFPKAKKLIEEARDITSKKVESFIQGKFPKFSLVLPKGGMEADFWNKCVIEISNNGDLAAKNVDLDFQGDVEVKGLDKIEKIKIGEKKRLEVGLKPKKPGELNTDVMLTYQRDFDDTIYQLKFDKKLNIDESGTYSIEDVFLIHNRGVLVTQASRKLDIDVDSDIFSGMLTAIQDFIQDSFKRSQDVGLKRMDFGANKLMIEHGRFSYIATVLTGGEPKYLPLYMLEVLKEVEEKFGQVLEDWDGTYAKLEGLNDVIGKLMQVTDEKGADVEGFESSSVASTIKLIQAANEEGVNIVAPESFANQLINIIEQEGFENAWSYLEKMGKEAEETSSEYKVKKEGLERLRHALLGDMEDHVIKDIGDSLEKYLTIVDDVIEVIIGIRNESQISESTPIKNVVIKSPQDEVRDAISKFKIPFLDKVKAKNMELLESNVEWKGLNLELSPKKEIINRVYKQQASKVMTLLRYQSPWKIKESLEKEGEYTLGVEGYPVKITSSMLDFKLTVPENVVVKEFDKGTIYIDLELSEELKTEGIVDLLIGYINEMRSQLNIKEEDYIETQVYAGDNTVEMLETQKELIKSKTRSYAVEFPFDNIFKSGNLGYYVVEKELAGDNIVIGIVMVEWEDG